MSLSSAAPPRTATAPPVDGWQSLLGPALLAPLVLVVHGFHPFANDAGIYTAGIRHILNPSLYSLNAPFVTAFTRYSVFPWVMAAPVRLLHIPLAWTLLVAQLISAFFFLWAAAKIAQRLFASPALRGSVFLAAACFTLPVAGTALSLMDPYVTPRSFSTPLALLAVATALDGRWIRTGLLLLLAVLLHPLMGAYAIGFVVLYACMAAGRMRLALSLCAAVLLAAGVAFALAHRAPPNSAWQQAVSLPPRSFLFLARWQWYEVLGLVLPLLLFAAAARRIGPSSPIGMLCTSSVLLGGTSFVIAALFVPPSGPSLLVPLQVLRSFHIIYALGVILCGGILAALENRSRIAALSLVALLFAGMFAAQCVSWPACRHIEWPGTAPVSPWLQAFLWIRGHTPQSAVFAFDPKLVYLPGEDEQGFRVIAERDHVADDKDAGIAAVLPSLASRWAVQRNAQSDVDRMTDAQRLAALAPLGVTWLLLPPDARTRFPCPFRNKVAALCKMAP